MTILNKDKHKIAYLAGLIDGEGSLMIAKMKTKRSYGSYITYSVRISIANTNMNLMFWLKDEFGAKIYPINGKSTPIGNRKFGYIALFVGKSALKILDSVRDCLIVKKPQAEILGRWPRNHSTCPEFRELLYQELKSLNLKGRPVAETECEGPDKGKRQSELLGNEPIEGKETVPPLLRFGNQYTESILC